MTIKALSTPPFNYPPIEPENTNPNYLGDSAMQLLDSQLPDSQLLGSEEEPSFPSKPLQGRVTPLEDIDRSSCPSTPPRISTPSRKRKSSPPCLKRMIDFPCTPEKTSCTPKKTFRISTTIYGNPGICTTPRTKKKKNVIYRIKNHITGECYVGLTSRFVGERVNEHNHYFRHFEKEMGQSRLYQEMREHPEWFSFGILYEATEGENLADLEEYYIDLKNSYENGYNQNRGGGGPSQGVISSSEEESIDYSQIKIQKEGAIKWYPIDLETLSFQLTPTSRHKRNVIYMIKDIETGQIYIGKTATEFASRVYAHNACIHSLKEKHQKPLYEAIRQNPENFVIGIIAETKSQQDLSILEAQLINEYDSQENGFNRNKGGGGGSSQDRHPIRKVRPLVFH